MEATHSERARFFEINDRIFWKGKCTDAIAAKPALTDLPPITTYGVTGTRAYGPITEGSDLDLVMSAEDAYQIKCFLMDKDIPIEAGKHPAEYEEDSASHFYFSIGGLLIDIITTANDEQFEVWKRRTKPMMKVPPISNRETRIKHFCSL